jgi:hypothetical protein
MHPTRRNGIASSKNYRGRVMMSVSLQFADGAMFRATLSALQTVG